MPAEAGPCLCERPRVPAGPLAASASFPQMSPPGSPCLCAVALTPGSPAVLPCRAPRGLPRALGELCGGDAGGDQPQERCGPGEGLGGLGCSRGMVSAGAVAMPSCQLVMRVCVCVCTRTCAPTWPHLSCFRPRWPPKASAEPLPCHIQSPSVFSGAPDAQGPVCPMLRGGARGQEPRGVRGSCPPTLAVSGKHPPPSPLE